MNIFFYIGKKFKEVGGNKKTNRNKSKVSRDQLHWKMQLER